MFGGPDGVSEGVRCDLFPFAIAGSCEGAPRGQALGMCMGMPSMQSLGSPGPEPGYQVSAGHGHQARRGGGPCPPGGVHRDAQAGEGRLIGYPKSNRSDIDRYTLRPIAAEFGLSADVQAAVGDRWSELRFRARRTASPIGRMGNLSGSLLPAFRTRRYFFAPSGGCAGGAESVGTSGGVLAVGLRLAGHGPPEASVRRGRRTAAHSPRSQGACRAGLG